MAQIDQNKLALLHTYFKDGGKNDVTAISKILNVEKSATNIMKEYGEALRTKYPDEYDKDGYITPVKPVDPVVKEYHIEENGFLKKLAIKFESADKIVFEVEEPKELVSILVKGKITEVDLIQLRKDPVENATLIALAELAKG